MRLSHSCSFINVTIPHVTSTFTIMCICFAQHQCHDQFIGSSFSHRSSKTTILQPVYIIVIQFYYHKYLDKKVSYKVSQLFIVQCASKVNMFKTALFLINHRFSLQNFIVIQQFSLSSITMNYIAFYIHLFKSTYQRTIILLPLQTNYVFHSVFKTSYTNFND